LQDIAGLAQLTQLHSYTATQPKVIKVDFYFLQ